MIEFLMFLGLFISSPDNDMQKADQFAGHAAGQMRSKPAQELFIPTTPIAVPLGGNAYGLKRFHGFLENFNPELGFNVRGAYWSNQWVHLANGSWQPVNEFKFSVDATCRNKQCLDFAGGVQNGKFFLRNGGFFAGTIEPGTVFSSERNTTAPVIDFNKLP
jgi:hypothetical protein